MGKHVSKAHDLVNVADLVSKVRVISSQSGQRLTDDLELSLHNELQSAVFPKLVKGLAVSKDLGFLDRTQDILAELAGTMQHR